MPKIGCQNMYSTLKRVVLCPPKKGMSQANFREWHYDGPLNQQKLFANFKEFEDIIYSNGCEVIMLDSEENLFDKGNVIIIRDNWGTPHIYGKSDADAAFGLAYAHSEDDFITIQDQLLRARGKYSSIYGKGKNKYEN